MCAERETKHRVSISAFVHHVRLKILPFCAHDPHVHSELIADPNDVLHTVPCQDVEFRFAELVRKVRSDAPDAVAAHDRLVPRGLEQTNRAVHIPGPFQEYPPAPPPLELTCGK